MILERLDHTTLGQLSKEAEAGNRKPVRSFSFHNIKSLLLTSDGCRLPPALRLRTIPLPTPRQPRLPPRLQPPLRVERYPSQEAGREWYRSTHQSTAYRCTRNGIQYEVGSTSTIIVSDRALKHRIGTWSLDPVAPRVPAQDLVQMFLDGGGEKKRRCGFRRSKKKLPPTAMLCSRHGNIHTTVRVVGESALRTVATIHSKTRGGNIFIDVVSL